jgi:hypothetical protein
MLAKFVGRDESAGTAEESTGLDSVGTKDCIAGPVCTTESVCTASIGCTAELRGADGRDCSDCESGAWSVG